MPDQLSIVAWDDSPLCRLTHPALTRDITGYGSKCAEVLLALIETGAPKAEAGTFSVQCRSAQLSPRGSTGPAVNAASSLS